MDTVQSWMDAKEINRLGEALVSGGAEAVDPEAENPVDEDASESTPSAVVTRALAVARKVAEGSGMLDRFSTSDSQRDLSGFQDVRELDPMLMLDLTEKWSEMFALNAMVLMAPDFDCEVLFDSLGDSRITQMAQKLAMSSAGKRVAGAPSSLSVRVAAGAFLQVVCVSTVRGMLAVGVLVESALPSDQVEALVFEVREALKSDSF